MSFLFEVEDLKAASPAIISKCGIVYNDHKDYGWRLYVNSWLNSCTFKLFKDDVIKLIYSVSRMFLIILKYINYTYR